MIQNNLRLLPKRQQSTTLSWMSALTFAKRKMQISTKLWVNIYENLSWYNEISPFKWLACKGIAFIYDANNRNNNSKLDDIYRKNSFAMWAKEFFLMWLYTIRCMRLSCRDNQEDDCKVFSVLQYVAPADTMYYLVH